MGGKFDPTKGYLAPYLGESGWVRNNPLLLFFLRGASSFGDGTGGYGYNATYICGTPPDMYQPINILKVTHPARTVMFTTTAFASGDGIQEYAYCEPYGWG